MFFFFDFVFFCFWKQERKRRGRGGSIGGWLPLSVFVFLSPRVWETVNGVVITCLHVFGRAIIESDVRRHEFATLLIAASLLETLVGRYYSYCYILVSYRLMGPSSIWAWPGSSPKSVIDRFVWWFFFIIFYFRFFITHLHVLFLFIFNFWGDLVIDRQQVGSIEEI